MEKTEIKDFSLWEYGETTVKRTALDLKDEKLNHFHFVSGATSEIADELFNAILKNDEANIKEELGDAIWFLVGLLRVSGLWKEEYKETINNSDSLFAIIDNESDNPFKKVNRIKYILGFVDELRESKNPTQHLLDVVDVFIRTIYEEAIKTIGEINTLYKNNLIKDVFKHDGKIYTEEDLLNKILECIYFLNFLGYIFEFTPDDIRITNDKKLSFRYSGGGFNKEQSLNRDLEGEREILEEK